MGQVFSCPCIKYNNSLLALVENPEVLLLCQHWMHSSQEQKLIIEKKHRILRLCVAPILETTFVSANNQVLTNLTRKRIVYVSTMSA